MRHKRPSNLVVAALLPLVLLLAAIGSSACGSLERSAPPSASAPAELPLWKQPGVGLSAAAAEALLWAELNLCFPDLLRDGGGFHAVAGPRDDDPVFSVQQARLTWLAAEVARLRPAVAERFGGYAEHGIDLLAGSMWDGLYGGWYWELSPDATPPTDPAGTEKHLYAQVFGLYAAANAYRVTGDAKAERLATAVFEWLETYARDTEHGGYFEVFDRGGRPLLDADGIAYATTKKRNRDHIGTPFGHKSMNAHIHALEAVTVWREAKPGDSRVEARLRELLTIVRDRIVQPDGGLAQVLTREWRPIPGHRSYGHEVETAFLMIEAAEALDDKAELDKTWPIAKRMVDDAIDEAIDPATGALVEDPVHAPDKRPWWAQVEMLNALLLMDAEYGSGDPMYRATAERLWAFTASELVDKQGRWVTAADPAGRWSGRRWYAAYHTGRAMLEVADRLRVPGEVPRAAGVSPHPLD